MSPTKIKPAILIGGFSRRMGRDKSLMQIDGKPNSQRLFDIASEVFAEEPIFCGAKKPELNGAFLADANMAKGPMDALISLYQTFSETSFCLIACDLVRLTQNTLRWLKKQHLEHPDLSTIPKSVEGFLEPTLAIYHPSAFGTILDHAHSGQFSLQRLSVPARNPLVPEKLRYEFRNANHPEDWPN